MIQLILWLFVIILGVNLGAGLYETRIVVPLWAGGVPETLAEGNPYGRVAIDAGVRFWAFVTSAALILAIVALASAFWAPVVVRGWLIGAAVIEIVAVAWTLLYFRPTLIRLFMHHGEGMSADRIVSDVQRWVMLNNVRMVIVLVALCAALRALSLS